ncbi:hypothetical protein CVT25_015073, partial [Psilocybe cyanescens]
ADLSGSAHNTGNTSNVCHWIVRTTSSPHFAKSVVLMSLSAEAQTTHVVPTLPTEIMDEIIDEACRILDVSSISSVALSSHVFRIHANKARFSSLVPHRNNGHGIQHTAKRIKGLADINRSGHTLSTLPGVFSFATSFSLQMIGYYNEVMPALNDGNLAYIFRNLFRPPLHKNSASSICSLSLHVYRWSRRDDDDYDDPRYGAMHWLSMNSVLLQEFKALLRESDITRLCLEVVRHIPRDFLQGTKIKHLYLRRVSIYPFGHNNDTTSDPKPVPLESLDIDDSVSATELGQIALPHPQIKITLPLTQDPLLPSLTKLHVTIMYISMFERLNELLNNTPHLQSLALTLYTNSKYFPFHQNYSPSINYNHLKHLNRISFVNGMTSSLSLVVDLIRYDISTVITELEIQLQLRRYDILGDVIGSLKSHNINILDSHLVHPAFDTIRLVVIGVEAEMTESGSSWKLPSFFEECRSYVKSQLPLLLEKKPDTQVYVRWKE